MNPVLFTELFSCTKVAQECFRSLAQNSPLRGKAYFGPIQNCHIESKAGYKVKNKKKKKTVYFYYSSELLHNSG